ncbi:ABC transporter ATP-binding protein [Dendrosporobacter sp. 1207_IL3150]|uniref:ABC transporter ATP-binding protein n=1 Tax=Dendrosporobacter sp. 1207_IL3150 TaxID=3084054 RepID=UPI002FDA301A
MIRFEGVSKMYGDSCVVNNSNLHINQGEIVALIGPSGSGKTTTMKMINRLIDPTEGRIFIGGTDILKLNVVELRRNIGYVIQNIGLLPHMTIADNVALVPRLKQWDENVYRKRADELMDMVGLDPETYRNRYPSELSGGQQQRIGVIRALAADPEIVLMDEPFSALDPISREQLQDEIVYLQQKLRKTIVFVTHDIDEAIKIADRICILNCGEVIQTGTPEQILRHPANDFVKNFIGLHRLSQTGIMPEITEIMIRPVTSKPNRGLTEALNNMRKQRVDSLLIVDQNERLLGIVGVWEIQNKFQNEALTVGDVMNPNLPVVLYNQPLSEAVNIISRHQVAYLPVIDDNRRLLGVITRAGLVDVMAKQLGATQPQRVGGVQAC